MEKYNIQPREALHAACMISNNISAIISFDMEFDLIKELEEKEEKDNKKEEGMDETVEVEVDWENLNERKSRLTVHTSGIRDWELSVDGEQLYYLTSFEGNNDLWVTSLRTKDTRLFTKINGRSTSMEMSDDGSFILVLSDGKPVKVDIKDGKSTPVRTNGEMVLKQDEERAYIFDHSWRQVREKFYVVDLQGVDWDFYYSEYKKSQSKHIDKSKLDEIKDPIIKGFLIDLVNMGYEPTREKWRETLRNNGYYEKYDFDVLGDVAEWIKGSQTNTNNPNDEPPEWVFELFDEIKSL